MKRVEKTDVFMVPSIAEPRLPRSNTQACLLSMSGLDAGKLYLLGRSTTVGRDEEAGIRALEEGISRVHCLIQTAEDGAAAVLDEGSTNGTFVNEKRVIEQRLFDGDRIRLGQTKLFRFTLADEIDQDFQARVFDAMRCDLQTGAYNSRHFEARFSEEIAFARRHGTSLALCLFEPDHLKYVTDTWGPPAGDFVMQQLTELLTSNKRREDVLCRLGGEALAVLTRQITSAQAGVVSERLRLCVEGAAFVWEGEALPLTVSAGVAGFVGPGDATVSELVEAADRALLQARQQGGNQVGVAYEDQ